MFGTCVNDVCVLGESFQAWISHHALGTDRAASLEEV